MLSSPCPNTQAHTSTHTHTHARKHLSRSISISIVISPALCLSIYPVYLSSLSLSLSTYLYMCTCSCVCVPSVHMYPCSRMDANRLYMRSNRREFLSAFMNDACLSVYSLCAVPGTESESGAAYCVYMYVCVYIHIDIYTHVYVYMLWRHL